jgi:long-subunit acyl-CoA synthetase (AMP-forming)
MLLGALIALNQGTAIAPYQLEDKLGSQHTVHSLYTYGRNPPLLIVRQKGY